MIPGHDRARRLLRDLCPPALWRWARRFSRYGWSGDYASWADAVRASEGYGAPQILDKVTQATTEVLEGRAAFERDGVAFEEPEVRWPLVACLLFAAARQGGRLTVLDFGGSLASTYLQHRDLLGGVPSVQWCVVEQAQFVARAAQLRFPPEVSFFTSLEACAGHNPPDVILLSSVLQYLPSPYDTLRQLLALGAPFVVLDRTPTLEGGRDRLTIQRVPPRIYRAIYPSWFLSRQKLADAFHPDHQLIAEFESLDRANIDGRFLGMLWQRGPRVQGGRS